MLCCSSLFVHCNTADFTHSNLFQELFSEEKSTFRGTDLGDPMTLVKQNEAAVASRHNNSGAPKHDDRLGLAFEYTLTDSLLLFVEYYPRNPLEQSDSNQVASIVANISLNDEVEIAQIYNEIQQYFARKYRISSGTYGNYNWKSSTPKTQSMEVGLKMSDNKKGITIMFIDTQTR
jgi:hypothetical protein